MRINQYDSVLLKDGQRGAVVEVFGDGAEFLVDIGSSPADWDTITVFPGDIQEVLERYCPPAP